MTKKVVFIPEKVKIGDQVVVFGKFSREKICYDREVPGLLKKCNLDSVSSSSCDTLINLASQEKETGEKEVELGTISFESKPDLEQTKKILVELKIRGYRPATYKEGLFFEIRHYKEQKEKGMVSYLNPTDPFEGKVQSYLCFRGGMMDYYLGLIPRKKNHTWSKRYWFLMVKEKV